MPTFMKAPRLQPPMSKDMDDVRRALTIVFRGADGLARPDVERAFSFDMEWVAPHEAEDVVNALLAAGWLEERGAELHLAVPLGTVDVPFGWFPRPTRLLRPVPASSVTDGTETAVASPSATTAPSSGTAAASAVVSGPTRPASSGDPRARLTQRVASSSLGKAVWNSKNCTVERTARPRRSNSSLPGWPTPWSHGNRDWSWTTSSRRSMWSNLKHRQPAILDHGPIVRPAPVAPSAPAPVRTAP